LCAGEVRVVEPKKRVESSSMVDREGRERVGRDEEEGAEEEAVRERGMEAVEERGLCGMPVLPSSSRVSVIASEAS
jgi:hypothetical protein